MKPSDFITEHNALIAVDAEEMHRDQEVQMARSDLYNSADYAIKLHKILRGVSDSADMEQWVMEKIAIANDYLRTVYEYLNYQQLEQEALPALHFESLEQDFETLVAESASVGGTSAGAIATGPVGAAAPMQRRVKKESSSKPYGNSMKTKEPKLGKGVY
jgi:hypothetical protein